MSITLFALIGISAVFYLWRRISKSRPSVPLPPGPRPVPFLGNVKDLTPKELWLSVAQWNKAYGDVVYLHVLGQGLVFLGTQEASNDLMEKRGSIYSDKPQLVMAGELCGCKNMVAFTGYGSQSKRQRQLMSRALSPQVIPTYHPLIKNQTKLFLSRLIADSSDFTAAIRRYAGALTLEAVYGYEIKQEKDEFLDLAEHCVDILANRIASGGGIWVVDIFPFLRYIPTWLPGAGFKRNAGIWKTKMEEMVDRPFEYFKSSVRNGTASPSFCYSLLEVESKNVDPAEEFDIKWTASTMYASSIDTTLVTIGGFILAMVLNPEVLRKAQEEVDSVVGKDRLPEFGDRISLPYVSAVMDESLRWTCPAPLGLPHRLMEADVYRGMFIPKGSLVFGNIWAMTRDEQLYPDPEKFVPERFLEEADDPLIAKRRNPRNYVFGFGRRICPGLHLVEDSIWLLMACMIATLDIEKAVDAFGNVIEPEIRYENSFFRTPSPFECAIRPRSDNALRIIG